MSGAHFDFCKKDSSHCLDKSTSQSGSIGIILSSSLSVSLSYSWISLMGHKWPPEYNGWFLGERCRTYGPGYILCRLSSITRNWSTISTQALTLRVPLPGPCLQPAEAVSWALHLNYFRYSELNLQSMGHCFLKYHSIFKKTVYHLVNKRITAVRLDERRKDSI